MLAPPPPLPAGVELHPAAPADRARVEALLRPYLLELAPWEAPGTLPDPTAYPLLDRYWEEPGRHAWLVLVDGVDAGFALVRRYDAGADVVSVMAEFYVAPGHRRRGVGRAVALHLMAAFPGRWEVRQLLENAAARAFWSNVLERAARGPVVERTEKGGRAVVAELVVPSGRLGSP